MENGIGIDDYLALCEAVGYVPAITVRLQYATPEEVQEARDWVEYCNGNTSTVWGKVRASRGHPEPYNVRYWRVQNPFRISHDQNTADNRFCSGIWATKLTNKVDTQTTRRVLRKTRHQQPWSIPRCFNV